MAEIPRTLLVTAALIEQDGLMLIAQRRLDDNFPGYWEFPGGKIEPGESPEEALQRECKEELDIEIEVGRIYDVVFHRYEDLNVLLLFYVCRIISGSPCALHCEKFEWTPRTELELEKFRFLPADIPLIAQLRENPLTP